MAIRAAADRRGRYLVVAGPDGTGKSTVAHALREGPLAGTPTLHLHHRPRVLGSRTPHDGAPVTEPHRDEPYPGWASALKVCFLYADYVLGWVLRMRPALRRGEDVVMERGWWDLVVDPRRYRLAGGRLAAALGRLLPRPDVTIVLGGDADIIGPRTGELPRDELQRQLSAWPDLPPEVLRPVHIDSTRPLEEVTAVAASAVESRTTAGPRSGEDRPVTPQRWVSLPPGGSPRWWLPAAPAAATANGFLMYSPVTPRAVAAWSIARALAATGALRAAPSSSPPPAEVLEPLRPLVGPGGSLAVGRATHPGRYAALILGRDGTPALFAKVAGDADGIEALRREAEGTQALGRRCASPLRVPEVVLSRPGLLVLEAIPWRARARPWELPDGVAEGLGRLYATGGGSGASGPAHGDCAPWNLLRGAEGGWWLIDWAQTVEEAPPFHDVLHYVVQACVLLGRPRVETVVDGLLGRGSIASALAAYARGAGIPPPATVTPLLRYLEGVDTSVDLRRPEERRAARGRERLRAAAEEARW